MADKPDQQEYKLSEDVVILSTSDLHGNIVEFNEGFQIASGYGREELLGKPHNILRHPDMPKEAFKDFWQTIQAGRPWYGIVKNQRKDGRYYWVAANASPIIEQGKITGYLSVRYPATRQQIAEAQKLYADVKAGRAQFPWTRRHNGRPLTAAIATLAALVPMALLQFNLELPLWVQMAMGAIGITGVGFLLYQALQRHHIKPELQKGIEEIASGRFERRIEDDSKWGAALNMIRSRVGEQAARNFDALRRAQVMATALEAATTNIMIADAQFNIVSINRSLRDMFTRNESKLQAVLPNFAVDGIVGANMDVFHQNSVHQRTMLEALKEAYTANLEIGELIIRLTVTPIEMNGQRLGYVVEWLDHTIEANIVSEIAGVVDAMRHGNFDKRVEAEAEGAFLSIKNDINGAIDTIQEALNGITVIITAQSQGDLTKECVEDFDGQLKDLKDAINASSTKLKEIVGKAAKASDIVSHAAQDVSQGASDLSTRIQEQASALQETAGTMNEMSSVVQSNSEHAQQASQMANEVESKANEGADVMRKTIEAMNQIQESSHKIADIVTLIDSIAFQTNLLALNAAVEAARAGEHGRGFAVVAGEVRALAQKSAEAAKDIRTLIEESVNRIDLGTRLAGDSSQVLDSINESINTFTQMVNQIAQASSEQFEGIQQIHKAIGQIDQVTQQNASLVEETSVASQSMSEQAEILKEDMAFFNTGEAIEPSGRKPLALTSKKNG